MSSELQPVTIVDYGMGNIRSIESAIRFLGYECRVSGDFRVISRSESLVLPGVGAFPSAMKAMEDGKVDSAIREAVWGGKSKILGICLGMQLLAETSSEGGGSRGLGVIRGAVERFSAKTTASLPVPHIGFNSVRAPENSVLFEGLAPETDFYFVHSFRMPSAPKDALVATCTYGEAFVAAFESGSVFGTQFHPEKSQSNGLRLIKNFLNFEVS